jgi:predicted DNA-binding protein
VLHLCYRFCVASSTSSFRVSDGLKARLEEASRRMKKGKNRILTEALLEYLDRHTQDSLRAEARRQSLIASRTKWRDQDAWEQAVAETWNE